MDSDDTWYHQWNHALRRQCIIINEGGFMSNASVSNDYNSYPRHRYGVLITYNNSPRLIFRSSRAPFRQMTGNESTQDIDMFPSVLHFSGENARMINTSLTVTEQDRSIRQSFSILNLACRTNLAMLNNTASHHKRVTETLISKDQLLLSKSGSKRHS